MSEEQKLMHFTTASRMIDHVKITCFHMIMTLDATTGEQLKPLYEKRRKLVDKIPDFWATVLLNHPLLVNVMGVEEQECLRSLKDLEVETTPLGWRILLRFGENRYFANELLTKERTLTIGAKSTSIEWKEGQNLQETVFFKWFSQCTEESDQISDMILVKLWKNPVDYYQKPEKKNEDKKEEKGDGDGDGDGNE